VGVFIGMVVVVVVRAPGAALAVGQAAQSRHLDQLDHHGLGSEAVDGRLEEGLEVLADPDHHGGALQRRGVGGLQAGGVRRGAALDDQVRRAHALHDAGDQRVHRLDGGDHRRLGGGGRRGQAKPHGNRRAQQTGREFNSTHGKPSQ
jgi:hypothetical protein